MCNYTFIQIKDSILQWGLNDIKKELSKSDILEITKNEKEILVLDLTFEYCLAQIVVSKPIFAPYQFVSFEAMTLDSKKATETGQPDMVYFFYDSNETTENKVLEMLTFGVKFCSQYISEKLRFKFINKKGTVLINMDQMLYTIHPDDVNKINNELIDGEFVCVDTEAQYLVVKNNSLSIRIMPQFFNLK